MAHAFSMNYEREIRENEIRLRNEQIAERRGWPGIGTLPKKYHLPETVEGDLEIYWNSLVDSGLGWHSVKANYGAARRCIKALMDAGLSYETALIDREEVLYLRDTEFRNLAPDTVKWYICLFGKYLRLFGNTVVDDMNLQWHHSAVNSADWLTKDQAMYLLGMDGLTPMQSMALTLMLGMGLRRVEVIRLQMEDIKPEGLIVRGKGVGIGKYRFVPYPAGAKFRIDEFLRWRRGQVYEAKDRNFDYIEDLHVFLTQTERPHGYNEAATGFDKSVLIPIRKLSGIDFGNHTLRRTFARLIYLDSRTDETLRRLARILGHSSPQTTLRYIGITDDELRETMEGMSLFRDSDL